MGVSFTTAAGPCQRSQSWILIRLDSWPYFTVSDSKLPQLSVCSAKLWALPLCCGSPYSLYNTPAACLGAPTLTLCVAYLQVAHIHTRSGKFITYPLEAWRRERKTGIVEKYVKGESLQNWETLHFRGGRNTNVLEYSQASPLVLLIWTVWEWRRYVG
jgi:hypothetical protein